jgi:hypothetical protein
MSVTTRKYWVLAIHWDDATWGRAPELWETVVNKAGEMMCSGKMVLGTLGTRENPLGVADHLGRISWLPDWRRAWKKNAEPPVWTDMPAAEHSFSKTVRIFTSEAAANEFADFVLTHGARYSNILTEEEVESICPLPADAYIDAMIVDPTDSARIDILNSQKVTIEKVRATIDAYHGSTDT